MTFLRTYSRHLLRKSNHLKHLSINGNKRFLSFLSKQISDESEETIDVEKYRQMHGIKVFGNSVADPIHCFDSLNFPLNLEQRVRYLRYEKPTPVQSQAIPVIMQKRDSVTIASSGSGKTLCFVLPALKRTLEAGLNEWPKCLILTPTRELTHQIERVVKQFRTIRSVCLYGGTSLEIQEMLLKRGNPHIVIATPSRLQTILEKGIADLKSVDYVVVDEADLMLKMGLGSAFRQIMSSLPQRRQTLMFSATWPQSVQTIAEEYLKDYIRVMVSQTESIDSLTVNKNIEQRVKVCEESEKTDQLIEIINDLVPTVSGYIKTIIFVRHKTTANRLVKILKKESFPSRALHSDKTQNERDFIIREFRKGSIPILIATDVASRGLDFKNIRLVINYDFPSKIEDYIHRIGRTARHESKGIAVTLFTANNIYHKTSLLNVLRETNQNIDQKLLDLNSNQNSNTDDCEQQTDECH